MILILVGVGVGVDNTCTSGARFFTSFKTQFTMGSSHSGISHHDWLNSKLAQYQFDAAQADAIMHDYVKIQDTLFGATIYTAYEEFKYGTCGTEKIDSLLDIEGIREHLLALFITSPEDLCFYDWDICKCGRVRCNLLRRPLYGDEDNCAICRNPNAPLLISTSSRGGLESRSRLRRRCCNCYYRNCCYKCTWTHIGFVLCMATFCVAIALLIQQL